jgi:hypothetical protein
MAYVPKRNMEDVMGLSVGSFAEDETCSWVKSTVRQWRDDDNGVLELVRYLGCLATEHNGKHGELLEYDAEAQRWAVELSEGGRKLVRAPNLAVLSRDDCPPSLHDVVMLSRGAGKDPGVGGRGGGGLGAAHACDGGQQRPGGDTFAHAARGDTHTHTHTNTHQKKRVWIALFVFLS